MVNQNKCFFSHNCHSSSKSNDWVCGKTTFDRRLGCAMYNQLRNSLESDYKIDLDNV